MYKPSTPLNFCKKGGVEKGGGVAWEVVEGYIYSTNG
jgi:hypothetical protein